MEKNDMTDYPEENLWNDLDKAMLRAKNILGPELELPTETETMETGLFKVVTAIIKLCDKIEKPKLILPKERKIVSMKSS